MHRSILGLLRSLAYAISVGAIWVAGSAQSADLNITPIAQQSPEWCYAASSAMILDYLGVPDINPGGDYQCGVVGARGGPCSADCRWCAYEGGGTSSQIAAIIRNYIAIARARFGYTDHISISVGGRLSKDEIKDNIDSNHPIFAGISPTTGGFPGCVGCSEHAVVIEGYNGDPDDDDFTVIVNDPYPPTYPMWVNFGGQELIPGQYEIEYDVFVQRLHYANSILFS
jgi:hypothetical protein